MAFYQKGLKTWVTETVERPPLYSVGESIIIADQEVTIVGIAPCHSVSGPFGCLLKRYEELPESYFKFLGYYLYFNKEINYPLYGRMSSIIDYSDIAHEAIRVT